MAPRRENADRAVGAVQGPPESDYVMARRVAGTRHRGIRLGGREARPFLNFGPFLRKRTSVGNIVKRASQVSPNHLRRNLT